MAVRIPVGNRYTASVTGSLWKPVVCAHCGCEYVYRMHRQATGQATSVLWLDNRGAAEQARSNAVAELHSQLGTGIDAVPCPDCGMYQDDMIQQLKGAARRSAGRVAWSLGFVAASIGLIASVTMSGWPKTIVLLSVFCVWLYFVLRMVAHAAHLSPNERAAKRRGRTYSEDYPVLRRREFEALQAQSRD